MACTVEAALVGTHLTSAVNRFEYEIVKARTDTLNSQALYSCTAHFCRHAFSASCCALVSRRSEEQRLEVSRALIDFQMETNEAKQDWANTK